MLSAEVLESSLHKVTLLDEECSLMAEPCSAIEASIAGNNSKAKAQLLGPYGKFECPFLVTIGLKTYSSKCHVLVFFCEHIANSSRNNNRLVPWHLLKAYPP